jgi:hypothetical protein
MGATPERIRSQRHANAMVALDTVELVAERVVNLLSHGRRMTMTRRYTHTGHTPEVKPGLTLDGMPRLWQRDGGAGLGVHLKPGLGGFGFSAYAGEANTEAQEWKRFHADPDDRRNMTEVEIIGGLPGDGPARDDQLTIRYWNSNGVCDERVIAFDYETGRENKLTRVRDELREHVEHLADKQPWENRDMFERVLAALETHAAVVGEDD